MLPCRLHTTLSRPKNSQHRLRRGDYVPFKVGEIISLIEADGWYLVATRGSHRQFKHPAKPGRVTVAGKPSADLPLGTERSILKQAGISGRAL
ncbi:MAG: type II toxin-antitoxin system HicA family toxin [Trebonia sp.]